MEKEREKKMKGPAKELPSPINKHSRKQRNEKGIAKEIIKEIVLVLFLFFWTEMVH